MFNDSAKFWFPKLAEVEKYFRYSGSSILIPKTVFVDYNEADIFGYGESAKAYEDLYYKCEAAMRTEITTPTAFVRTDVTSAKHLGIKAIQAGNGTHNLNFALRKTLRHAETKTYLSKNKSSAVMLRDWIDTDAKATAFGGLPIVKEWRVFANDREKICVNGYWPDEALAGHMDNGADIPTGDTHAWYLQGLIDDAAVMAAHEMGGGTWSVDFMEDRFGRVWLIDMATAENSYHNPNCRCGLETYLAYLRA